MNSLDWKEPTIRESSIREGHQYNNRYGNSMNDSLNDVSYKFDPIFLIFDFLINLCLSLSLLHFYCENSLNSAINNNVQGS